MTKSLSVLPHSVAGKRTKAHPHVSIHASHGIEIVVNPYAYIDASHGVKVADGTEQNKYL